MKPAQLVQLFREEGIRSEKAIWLGAQLEDEFPEDVKEITSYNFNEKSPEQVRDLFLAGMAPGSGLELPDEDVLDDDSTGFMYWLDQNELYGHLIQFAVPVRMYGKTNLDKPDNFWTSGFGYYNTEWFYTEKFDKAFFLRIKAWAEALAGETWEQHLKEHGQNQLEKS